MPDRPILFSGPMVRALLDGRKMQTRRLLKPKKRACLISEGWTDDYVLDPGNREWLESYYRWRVGDRLYVRETFSGPHDYDEEKWPPRAWFPRDPIWYWADGNPVNGDWTRPKPGIHMPRWASRLTLTVTDVRVQRLQEISEEDAKAEGAEPAVAGHGNDGQIKTYRTGFVGVWQAINGNWLDNPWVVAVSFRADQRNIDAPLLLSGPEPESQADERGGSGSRAAARSEPPSQGTRH